MLTTEEKRFIRYWQEQRTGGKTSYFLLYLLLGSFIMSLFGLVILLFFLQFFFSWKLLIITVAISFMLTGLMTVLAWSRNERRWKSLIRREIKQGELTENGN
jgi:ABC-type bacteriocin/lantibiotic exporter with double-glycine peptidase domain